jgi:hypothetical protein
MTSIILKEFNEFFSSEAAPNIDLLNTEDLVGFGIMDSSQYRGIYLKHTKSLGFKMEDHIALFLMVNQVKSLERLTDQRGMKKESFKAKYGKEAWYNKVLDFLDKKCVMYVAQVKRQTGMADRFPLVNINTCWPSMAFVAFCYRIHGDMNVSAETDDSILEKLLKPENTWMVQMFNDKNLQDQTKAANQKFWTTVVTKSNNSIKGAYEGDRSGDITKGYWNDNYYKTQEEDQYVYMTLVAGFLKPVPGIKTASEVAQLVRSFK